MTFIAAHQTYQRFMLKNKLLQYSYEKGLSHIPSALSMLDYVDVLFSHGHVTIEDKIVIGKPFGSQAYYLVWGIEDRDLSVGVKHDEIEFVDYGEETMGNALGVAAGMAIANPNSRIWVNISDGALQMGNTLEAIQFIGSRTLPNILLTVDYNQVQVTGHTYDIINTNPVIQLMYEQGWDVIQVDGHDHDKLNDAFNHVSWIRPTVVICHTKKGNGVQEMEDDPFKWHYRKIADENELTSLL